MDRTCASINNYVEETLSVYDAHDLKESCMNDEARRDLHHIIDRISLVDRQMIADLPEEQVIKLHHTIGRSIRNEIRSGKLGALARWADVERGDDPKSFDALSWPIIREIWKNLRAREHGRNSDA